MHKQAVLRLEPKHHHTGLAALCKLCLPLLAAGHLHMRRSMQPDLQVLVSNAQTTC